MLIGPSEGVDPGTNQIPFKWESILQRLFSMFPNSWPGVGLLLLRHCVAIALLYFGISGISKGPATITFAQDAIAAAGGILLLAGIWTPVAGSIVSVDEAWIALWRYPAQQEHTWIHISLAILAISVAMLGPGAWSIDARLFGRKRFDINQTRSRKPSL
jgi:putative oxidoreductase